MLPCHRPKRCQKTECYEAGKDDGLLGEYIPDFLVATAERIFIVETKAEKDKQDANVQAKRLSALEWCRTINALLPI